MSSPLPHLNVRRRAVRPTSAIPAKNFLAIQSALIHGDRHVTLDNTSRILSEDCDELGLPYEPPDLPPDQPFECPFGDDYSESHSDDTDQPSIVGNYIELFNWDGFRLEWVKILGQGGFGMATLWNAIFDDQSCIKVVIKIPIHANGTFGGELDWHLRYRGASHITQSLDLQEIADNVRRRINRGHMINRGVRFDQKDLDILVLEYAEHGCLFDIMSKASYFGVRFSNKVLWEIWECLVKGVVSVALQPDSVKRWSPDSLDMILNSLDNPQNIDELLRLSTLIDSHDVHFDLEEQNILIAEDDHHSHHPIFKFHDFGDYSHKMRECWDSWNHYEYWRARKCPKNNRTPPETISEDWDKVDLSRPGSVLQYTSDTFGPEKSEVAGRYGTWTNIFTIGKIMESVITKSWSAHPMTTMIYEAGDERCLGNSYAWRLSEPDYSYIEPELLDQIAQCQFEKPKDRPQLSYLLKNVCERKHHGFEESDDETRLFWDTFWARTRTNPADQPPIPFSDSQASTTAVKTSGTRGHYPTNRSQRDYRSDPFARPSFPGSRTGTSDRQSPSSPSRYDEVGNPLITHVAALQRKSRRSLLGVSSEESSPNLYATALNPSAGSLSANSAPSSGNQRKRSSSGFSDNDPDGGVFLRESKRVKHNIVPVPSSSSENLNSSDGGAPLKEPIRSKHNLASITSASSIDGGVPLRGTKGIKHNSTSSSSFSPSGSINKALWISGRAKKQPVKSRRSTNKATLDIISQSISDNTTRLNWAWPIMTMAPRHIPNILEVDIRDAKRLAEYAVISPERSNLSQISGGFSFTKRSDPSNYESVDEASLRLRFGSTMMPVDNTVLTPMEAIPEETECGMDLDL